MQIKYGSFKTGVFLLFCTLSTFAVFSGCRKSTTWNPEILLPLFKTELSLNDINGNLLRTNATDSSFDLVFDKLIYTQKLSDVKTPDTSINTSFNLRRLKLSDRSISQRITLAQINPLFSFLDGKTVDVPAQNLTNLSPVDIDASEFFETATLDSGFLDISLKNELPVTVQIIEFELRNGDDNSLIAKDTFQNLLPNTSRSKSVDLAGKTVKKNLKGTITRLETLASPGPVLVDAKKGVDITLSVRKLQPKSAVAAFPNQTVIDQDEGLTLDMGGPQIKYFKVKSGKLKIRLVSTIQENMTMDFQIPSASINGNTLKRIIKLNGAPYGGNSSLSEDIDLSGYLLDFRGKNPVIKDTVNTFHQILKVTLDSSGRKVAIALRDSIQIIYSLESLIPEYAIGYLGQTLDKIPLSTTPFSLFKGLSGDLKMDDLKASILIKNGIGAQGRIKVNNLIGKNIFNGNSISLNASPLQSAIDINPAMFSPFQESTKEIVLNSTNSNVKTFTENLPQELTYSLDIETNPNGNVSNWNDFIYDQSKIDIYLRIETPASIGSNGLILRDTQPVNFSNVKNFDKVKGAIIFLEVQNDYPVEALIELSFLDAFGNVLATPAFSGGQPIIPPGFSDGSGNIVSSKTTRLSLLVPPSFLDAFKKSSSVGIKVQLKTDSGNKVKLYNTQKIKIKTSTQFTYESGI